MIFIIMDFGDFAKIMLRFIVVSSHNPEKTHYFRWCHVKDETTVSTLFLSS